jgi:hypothetical protein
MPDEYNQRLSGTYSDAISSWHHLGMAALFLALWWWVELLWRSELPELSLLPLCLRLLFSLPSSAGLQPWSCYSIVKPRAVPS